MAHIHRGRNFSEEKLRRMRFSPGAILTLILCLVLLPASIWGIVQIIRDPWIGLRICTNVGARCLNFIDTSSEAMSDTLFGEMLSIILSSAGRFFSACLAFIIGILCYILPPILGFISASYLWSVFINPQLSESNEEAIMRVGLEGEEKALRMVSELDNSCHIYTNLVIPHNGKTSETDMIAVTPHGVTVIEVKNIKGTLHGDFSDEKLIHRKQKNNGKYKDKELYNPVRQVGTHVYRLAHYLRDHEINLHVRCCVLFVNPELSIEAMTDSCNILTQKCPVFEKNLDTEELLLCYLTDDFPISLSNTDICRIVTALNELL